MANTPATLEDDTDESMTDGTTAAARVLDDADFVSAEDDGDHDAAAVAEDDDDDPLGVLLNPTANVHGSIEQPRTLLQLSPRVITSLNAFLPQIASRLRSRNDEEDEDGNAEEEDEDEEYAEEDEDYDVDENDDDDEGAVGINFWNPQSRTRNCNWYRPQLEPDPVGVQLLRSGYFGVVPPEHRHPDTRYKRDPQNVHEALRRAECSRRPMHFREFGRMNVPNDNGTEVANFDARVYTGQFSADGSFFYTCSQNFHAYIYDMTVPPRVLAHPSKQQQARSDPSDAHSSSHDEIDDDDEDDEAAAGDVTPGWSRRLRQVSRQKSSLKLTRMFRARDRIRRWTITDAALSPDNNWMVYSSIAPTCHLVKTRGEDAVLGLGLEEHEQEQLEFSNHPGDDFGIYSLRFSMDGREIAAGCSRGRLSVFDLESRRTVSTVIGHEDDVNAVCFADQGNSNIIVSGSDDSLLKVWDRRNLRSTRAEGILVGHTEGITYVEGKGDGRYVLSNGKDQCAKLWDLRQMHGQRQWNSMPRLDVGLSGFDYRWSIRAKPKYLKHPQDVSVMTYRGHCVFQTLIRAHISPPGATDQQYIYSGSSDGKIHIWHLDGRIAQVIERGKARPLTDSGTKLFNNPMAPRCDKAPITQRQRTYGTDDVIVRDVSWHPFEPTLISTSWGDNRSANGSLAMHHYINHGRQTEPIDESSSRS